MPKTPKTIDSAVEIQREYYTKTASRYDNMHAFEGVDDPASSRMVLAILHSLGVRSILDVGSATGRGLQQFAASFPGALVCGVEPVALLQQGVAAGVTKQVPLLQGTGQSLPLEMTLSTWSVNSPPFTTCRSRARSSRK